MSFLMGLRGPKSVNIGELLFWEGLWFHEVFLPLRDGIPAVLMEEALEGPRPPRVPKATPFEELNKERFRDWQKRDRAYLAEMRKGRIVQTRMRWTKSVPDELHLWNALKRAQTAEEVRSAYALSKYWLNLEWGGRVYVNALCKNADKVIAAMNDLRYPRSNRASSDDKRLEFFAAAMAGITLERPPYCHRFAEKVQALEHVLMSPLQSITPL